MVNFVGAGSGAPDLITLRGFELIKKADVIIYAGSLVNPELLKNARVDCEIYNSALMTLDEVIEVMASSEKAGKMTVRLHTGDPSVFGAVREQFDRLERLGIPYTVTPGVSSFCAAAAALKAEYTLPGITQSVIITRREGKTAVPEKERIRELAKHTATMVIFLSASMTLQLSQELVE
ncbi:MAG: cobalt-precorrin-4/precorrin-4 C(11)-methyltransferase, partial [Clostridia bacterium]|nr:cobalt-precorrin-4/precorrin-4 C(11)-methyltransferase [Clostridia bacterium]